MEVQPYILENARIGINCIANRNLPCAVTLLAIKVGQAVRAVRTIQAGKWGLAAVDAERTFSVKNCPVEIFQVRFKGMNIIAVNTDLFAGRALEINPKVADTCMPDVQSQVYIENLTAYRHKNIFRQRDVF